MRLFFKLMFQESLGKMIKPLHALDSVLTLTFLNTFGQFWKRPDLKIVSALTCPSPQAASRLLSPMLLHLLKQGSAHERNPTR